MGFAGVEVAKGFNIGGGFAGVCLNSRLGSGVGSAILVCTDTGLLAGAGLGAGFTNCTGSASGFTDCSGTTSGLTIRTGLDAGFALGTEEGMYRGMRDFLR